VKSVNDGVRFILEMCALAAVGYWGWLTGNTVVTKVLLAAGAVILLAVVWAVFRAEADAVVEVSTAVRVLIEVAEFAVATAALVAIGRLRLAVVFALATAINEVLNYTLPRRAGSG
jgi:hypothetical protein